MPFTLNCHGTQNPHVIVITYTSTLRDDHCGAVMKPVLNRSCLRRIHIFYALAKIKNSFEINFFSKTFEGHFICLHNNIKYCENITRNKSLHSLRSDKMRLQYAGECIFHDHNKPRNTLLRSI